jgi:DNA-binding MarR family transcriptional regulator
VNYREFCQKVNSKIEDAMPDWKFITNHGAVLLLISQKERITARKLAQRVGITERSVLKIIKDLENDGYLSKERVGRENVYEVNSQQALRHQEVRDVQVGELVDVLSKASQEKS